MPVQNKGANTEMLVYFYLPALLYCSYWKEQSDKFKVNFDYMGVFLVAA